MRVFSLILLAACAPPATSPELGDADAGPVEFSPDAGPSGPTGPPPETLGGNRPTNVIYPADYDITQRWPLVVVLHGYTANGLGQDQYLGVSARADLFGFVTLAPNGKRDGRGNRFWNATEACCDFWRSGVDDLGYITGLIDEAVERVNVDPDRVYLVGHSNGGFMTNRIACDAADKVTAVMNIAGSSFMDSARCQPSEAVGYIQVHGTADTTIAYAGGMLTNGASYPGAELVVERWRARNGCVGEPSERQLDLDLSVPGEETLAEIWSDCDRGMDVQLWRMDGSPHVPGFSDTFRDELVAQLLSYRRP